MGVRIPQVQGKELPTLANTTATYPLDLVAELKATLPWILKVAADHDDEGDRTGLHARAMRAYDRAQTAILAAEAKTTTADISEAYRLQAVADFKDERP